MSMMMNFYVGARMAVLALLVCAVVDAYPAYLGCWNSSDDTLLPTVDGGAWNTVTACILRCSGLVTMHAEMRNGHICACGNTDYTVNGESPGDCNTPCPADHSKKCGGSIASSIYETGISCFNNPCQNGATCTEDETVGIICECLNNFSGKLCHVEDFCATASCENGGTCNTGTDTFSCDCVEGFKGTTCTDYSIYLGCWASKNKQLFPNVAIGALNSVTACITRCTRLGTKYTEVRNGVSCSCGNNDYTVSRESPGNCNTPCPANSSEMCGGPITSSIYLTDFCATASCENGGTCNIGTDTFSCDCVDGFTGTTCTDFSNYLGCWNSSDSTLLPNIRGAYGTSVTSCIARCTRLGTKYAELRNVYVCSCGDNDYTVNGESPGGCTQPCSGGTAEICGGNGKSSIYLTG